MSRKMSWFLLYVVLAVGACSGSSDNYSEVVSMTIGSGGGSIVHDEISVTIPAGALDEDTEITIGILDGKTPEGYTSYSKLFEFLPAGLSFNEPIEVTIEFSEGDRPATVYWSTSAGDVFAPIETTVSGSKATALIDHFSRGFVGPSLLVPGPCTEEKSSDATQIERRTYTYDNSSRLTKLIVEHYGNPGGWVEFETWNYSYNASGAIQEKQRSSSGTVTSVHSFTYGPTGLLTEVKVDTRGTCQLTGDSNSCAFGCAPPDGSTPEEIHLYEYDSEDRIVKITVDDYGTATQYTSTAAGCSDMSPYTMYSHDGIPDGQTVFEYNARGLIDKETSDYDGVLMEVYSYNYDALERLSTKSLDDRGQVTVTGNCTPGGPCGCAAAYEPPDGVIDYVWTYTYDAGGNPILEEEDSTGDCVTVTPTNPDCAGMNVEDCHPDGNTDAQRQYQYDCWP